MKKLFLLVLVIATAFSIHAQRATVAPVATGDTLVNTGTVTKVLTFTAGYEGVSIQPKFYRSVTGGTWAGTCVLYQSNDGVLYRSTGDTLKFATDTTVIWNKTAPIPVYYKMVTSGATTINAAARFYYVARKHD